MPEPRRQTLAESIPHIVWMASPNGEVEYLNRQAMDYVGWSPEPSFADSWWTAVHPDDVLSFRGAWLEAVRTATAFLSEFRLRRADGEFRWHCGRGLPMHDTAGDVIGWLGTATDIERYKRLEAALLATLQAEAPVGFAYVDRGLRFVRLNQELAMIIGASVEDAVGRPVEEVVRPELWEQLDAVFRRVLASGNALWNQRLAFARRDGAIVPVELSAVPLRDGSTVEGVVVVFR